MNDTPLPTFGDGKPAQLIFVIPTAFKHSDLDTDLLCTNLGTEAADVGLEVFDQTGVRGNAIATGNGAQLNVTPGQTITIGTTNTAALHEDVVIALEPPVTELRNGSARVVGTTHKLGCVAFAVDKFHTVEDPSVCPQCRPPSFVNLPVVTTCSPAACDDSNPCTADGCNATGACTHTAAADGTACDDSDACTTSDTCSQGVCFGTPVTCGPDTPCNQTAACDATSGQCGTTAPFSTCVPGGGDAATDCAVEWVVDNPANPRGPTSSLQICRQGDADCDFDIDRHHCTFHVRVCLNDTDVNLAACQPGVVSAYQIRHPGGAAGRAILDAVAALGPSSRSGKRMTHINFDPPIAAGDRCTPILALRVALGHPLVINAQSKSPTGVRDKDKLRLKCARRLPRPSKRRSTGGFASLVSSALAYLSRPTASYF